MKTVSFKFKTNDEALQKAISEDSHVCSSMRRFAYNRFKEGKNNKQVYNDLSKMFSNANSFLRISAMRSAEGLFNINKHCGKKIYFGKFKQFIHKLITKDEYRNSRDTGILAEGDVRNNGNRFFQLDIENKKIIWKRKRGEHYNLELIENLSDKRKFILQKLQLLMSEKKIPVTIKVKNNTIHFTYDESVVEHEKKFKKLFNNRILGIDLNPNYFGISVIEFNRKNEYKVLYKECVDLTELQLCSKDKIKFELYEINHHILRLCKNYHVGKLSVEDLKFDNKKKFWNKNLNRLCRNKFRFGIIKRHLQTLCNIYGAELVEVNAAYSSIEGNFRHGSETTPDPIASSIEIARRAYHKFQKGWFEPSFVSKERLQQVLGNQWKEELGSCCDCWKNLAEEIKKMGFRYRFPLSSLNAVFRKNYLKSHIWLYGFSQTNNSFNI